MRRAAGVGLSGLGNRLLLLMAGPLAEHAVQAQPDEQGDQGKDDDYGQIKILEVSAAYIVRLS
jgi:hypothetical protein